MKSQIGRGLDVADGGRLFGQRCGQSREAQELGKAGEQNNPSKTHVEFQFQRSTSVGGGIGEKSCISYEKAGLSVGSIHKTSILRRAP